MTSVSKNYEEDLQRKKRILLCILYGSIILVFAISITLFIGIVLTTYEGPPSPKDAANNNWKKLAGSIISGLYLVFLVIYIFTLSLLISRLKKLYGGYY